VPAASNQAVTAAGVTLPPGDGRVFDVLFDGHRVWSFNVPSPRTDPLAVDWPPALGRFLNGHARVQVGDHVTGKVVVDEEVQFGASTRRVRVLHRTGLPGSLDKSGRVLVSFDAQPPDTRAAVVDAVQNVLALLQGPGNVPSFVVEGTLLGAMREGGLLGHDHDADVAYLSERTHPFDVVMESYRLERLMRSHGLMTKRMSGADFKVLGRLPNGGLIGIDVNAAFVCRDHLYLMPHLRLPRTAVDVLVPVRSVPFEGHEISAPARPEALLEANYGSGWRVPDPAHTVLPDPAVVRQLGSWLRGGLRHRRAWNRFYTGPGRRPARGPSAFAEWVGAREPGGVLVDVGCGTGQDALWFAEHGFDVLGLDFSPAAVKQATERADGRARFEEFNLYEMRHVLSMGALLAHDRRPKIVYARSLVDGLDDDGRHNLWRLVGMALRSGGRCYVEFSLDKAEKSPGMRTPTSVSAEVVEQEMRARGGDVERSEDGPEPMMRRVVARWGG
jgi:SAM-dependent methyltransferase